MERWSFLSISEMQKVIPAGEIENYVNDQYNRVKGFVTREVDVAHLQTYDEIYDALCLDYPGSEYHPLSDESLGVIRYKTEKASKLSIPYRPEMGGTVTGDAPFTGNGFTGSVDGGEIISEYHSVDFLPLSEGAELLEIRKDGKVTLRAVYSESAKKFLPVDQ